jgi:hypothetical protein
MRLRVVIAFLALVALGVLAGCGGSTSPTAKSPKHGDGSPGGSTSAGRDPLPRHGAPKVTNPLDVSAFLKKPCSVLTQEQLDGLDVAADGKTDLDAAYGPTCTWSDDQGPTGGSYGVTFFEGFGGISGAYANKDTDGLFMPLDPIEGYPAVIFGVTDSRADGHCSISVGLQDDVAIQVGATMRGVENPAPNYDNPCGVAHELARQMVKTIKGAQ